jgi:lipopolysaccharide transport protein LptA
LEYNGDPVLHYGNSSIRTGMMNLELSDEIQFIARFGVEVNLIPEPSVEGPSAPLTIKSSEMQGDIKSGEIIFTGDVLAKRPSDSLAGDEVRIQFDTESKKLMSITARKQVFYRSPEAAAASDDASYDAGENSLLLSGHARINYETQNKLQAEIIRIYPERKFYSAENQVKIEFVMPDSKKPQKSKKPKSMLSLFPDLKPGSLVTAQCAHSELDDLEGSLILSGSVVVNQQDYSLGAEEVTLSYDQTSRNVNSIKAKTKVIITQADRIITADAFDYLTTKNTFVASGNANYIQGKNQIRADQFTYFQNDGKLEMNGNIDIIMEYLMRQTPTAQKELIPIHLTAQKGVYLDSSRMADFSDQVHMNWENWTMKSNQLHLKLDPVTGGVKDAAAEGAVEVTRDDFKALGPSLTYSPEQSIIRLKGEGDEKCIVARGEHGTKAEEIIFYLNENRYTIENGLSVVMSSELGKTIK